MANLTLKLTPLLYVLLVCLTASLASAEEEKANCSAICHPSFNIDPGFWGGLSDGIFCGAWGCLPYDHHRLSDGIFCCPSETPCSYTTPYAAADVSYPNWKCPYNISSRKCEFLNAAAWAKEHGIWSAHPELVHPWCAPPQYCSQYSNPVTVCSETTAAPMTTTRAQGTATTTTTTTTITRPQCTPELKPNFCLLDGQQEPFSETSGACRAINVLDNCPSYYEVERIYDLRTCWQLCKSRTNCTGVEFSNGRCELWNREIGPETKTLAGYQCLRKNDCFLMPSGAAIDGCGKFNAKKPCNLTCPEQYDLTCQDRNYEVSELNSAWVVKDSVMAGVWNELVVTTECACAQKSSIFRFQPVDGGMGRACRGGDPSDNSGNYYSVVGGATSLDACKTFCIKNSKCKGIEYNPDYRRCEIWTRAGGVGSSTGVKGFTCLSFENRFLEGRTCTQWQRTSGAVSATKDDVYVCLSFEARRLSSTLLV
eukprot:TRINITY_DN80649_c0_g1_i1.p1 TRINITY_DN80649_c0_g1~~TRINITY_DN80649_c0_g1_i1.p1  ORF type:complete len:511 (-),score=64.17 TRINITY_DN80649_c0_g1_i1:568-2010(-)